MVRLGDDETPEAGRIASDTDRHRGAWGVTLDDVTAMTDEFKDEGWETIQIPAGDSGPFGPSSGKGGGGTFGFAYIIPGDKAETVADLFEVTSSPECGMCRTESNDCVYTVTALSSLETKTTVFIVGARDLREVSEYATVVIEGGWIYSYLQKLDGTVVGVVEYDDPEEFSPNLDAIRRYAPNNNGEGESDEN